MGQSHYRSEHTGNIKKQPQTPMSCEFHFPRKE
uniref:Uncharacterized protein n=1 Tax=Arundo donax TaxID=35708 RepID=A0A0A8Y971_ARUDO